MINIYQLKLFYYTKIAWDAGSGSNTERQRKVMHE